MNNDLLSIVKQNVNDKGIIVYNWLLCAILNDNTLPLTKTDSKGLIRLINKLEHYFNRR